MRDGDKVKVTRLHILEHPHLHGKPATDPPIHIVWEPHEFDWWQVNSQDRSLEIGFFGETHGVGRDTYTHRRVVKVISSGMFASVWEEATEYPDPIGKVEVDIEADVQVDVDRLRVGFSDALQYAPGYLFRNAPPDAPGWGKDSWVDAVSGELSLTKIEHADPTAEVIGDAPAETEVEVIRVESDEEAPSNIITLDRPRPSGGKGMQGYRTLAGLIDEIPVTPGGAYEYHVEQTITELKPVAKDPYETLAMPILDPPSSFFNAAPEPEVSDPAATRLDLETFKSPESDKE